MSVDALQFREMLELVVPVTAKLAGIDGAVVSGSACVAPVTGPAAAEPFPATSYAVT